MLRKKRRSYFRIISFLCCYLLAGCTVAGGSSQRTYNSALEYLKTIGHSEPADDPQLTFLLMFQYLNGNQLKTGIDYFENRIGVAKGRLPPEAEAINLAALGILRASYASQVSVFNRINWVEETIDILETARKLSENDLFPVRWSTGVVYAQLPDRFEMNEVALTDLQWCEKNISKAPHAGWLREVLYYQAVLHDRSDHKVESRKYLEQSGYQKFDKNIILTSPYSISSNKGLSFYPKRLKEVIPNKVFVLSGFEFTEYYFIVSDDRKELISIDAGTRPDSAEQAYRFLISQKPDLPPLTTVFVTHAHWDHIGGHRFFRKLNPRIKFYAQENYSSELKKVTTVSMYSSYFFGSDFKMKFVADFKPNILVEKPMTVEVGKSRFELIPVTGGETADGLFIHMPKERILFVGDFIMPYIGAPILEEGNVSGLFDAIDIVVELNPLHLLHGHEPLTRIWNSVAILAHLKNALSWLNQQTLESIRNGLSRAAIHHQNLVPPFESRVSGLLISYLVTRENFINRVYDQNVGYWQPDFKGMDHLSEKEMGILLTHYFDLSETEITEGVENMLQTGDFELAAKGADWALTQYPDSKTLQNLKTLVFIKLKEKYQEFSPFKFIIYSGVINNTTPQLELPGSSSD